MRTLILSLPDETTTARLAEALAPLLTGADVLLLEGQIGAGKSFFSRALIRARLGNPWEDVPSPTFTLVQTYEDETGLEIWHCDLYRLTHPDEAIELGLSEAMQSAICLIEWPDRLGDLAPATALPLAFEAHLEGHSVALRLSPEWDARIGTILEAFL